MTDRESDRRIVPFSAEDQSVASKSGNADAGKASKLSRDPDWASSVHRDGTTMRTRLDRISQRDEGDSKAVLNNLFSLLDYKLLYKAYGQLKKGKSPGVDGVRLKEELCGAPASVGGFCYPAMETVMPLAISLLIRRITNGLDRSCWAR